MTALVGCLGGGQLGRMLALAGAPLDVRLRFLDPAADACAGQVGELIVGAFDDPARLDLLADGADAVTYEFENVPVDAARSVRAVPDARALESGRTVSSRRSSSGGSGSRPRLRIARRRWACPAS